MSTKQQVKSFIKYYLKHYRNVDDGYATEEIFNIDNDRFFKKWAKNDFKDLQTFVEIESFIKNQKIKIKEYTPKKLSNNDTYCQHKFNTKTGKYKSSLVRIPYGEYFKKIEYIYYVLFHEFCHYVILQMLLKENKDFDYYHYIYLTANSKYKINEEIVCNLTAYILCKQFGVNIPMKILVSQFKYYTRFLNDINIDFLINSIDMCLDFLNAKNRVADDIKHGLNDIIQGKIKKLSDRGFVGCTKTKC